MLGTAAMGSRVLISMSVNLFIIAMSHLLVSISKDHSPVGATSGILGLEYPVPMWMSAHRKCTAAVRPRATVASTVLGPFLVAAYLVGLFHRHRPLASTSMNALHHTIAMPGQPVPTHRAHSLAHVFWDTLVLELFVWT